MSLKDSRERDHVAHIESLKTALNEATIRQLVRDGPDKLYPVLHSRVVI
jgi:hypothetical protein